MSSHPRTVMFNTEAHHFGTLQSWIYSASSHGFTVMDIQTLQSWFSTCFTLFFKGLMCIQSSDIMKQQPGNPVYILGTHNHERPPRSPVSCQFARKLLQKSNHWRRTSPGSGTWIRPMDPRNGGKMDGKPRFVASRRLQFSHLRIKSGYIDQLDWLINLALAFIFVVNQSILQHQKESSNMFFVRTTPFLLAVVQRSSVWVLSI